MKGNVEPIISWALIKRSALIFACAASLVTAIAFKGYQISENNRVEIIKTRESGYLAVANQMIRRSMFEPVADLNVVTSIPAVRNYLNNPTNKHRDLMIAALLSVSRSYQRYDQIRYLSNEGLEIIRISNRDGRAIVVPEEKLQSKAGRYYFENAMKLGPDEIYVSPLDLNIENGQVETPYRPTIRFAKHVFDSAGNSRGVVVINYNASEMLDGLDAISKQPGASALHIGMLLNEEGFWLNNPSAPEKAWGFALGRKDDVFATQFPDVWKQMQAQSYSVQTRDGLFLYEKLNPFEFDSGRNWGAASKSTFENGITQEQARRYSWILVFWIPTPSLEKTSLKAQLVFKYMIVLLYLLLSLCSCGIAHLSLQKRRQRELERQHAAEMEMQAHTDVLTGVANRRYFFELAAREIARCKRSGESLSLCMLDIDHFKQVNDIYGHDAGDRVLQTFAATCQSMVRGSDIFARLGGEEFVALLSGDANNAIISANRIRKAVAAKPVKLGSGDEINVSVSIGVSQLDRQNGDLEKLLHEADLALYEAKHNGRNRVFQFHQDTVNSN